MFKADGAIQMSWFIIAPYTATFGIVVPSTLELMKVRSTKQLCKCKTKHGFLYMSLHEAHTRL